MNRLVSFPARYGWPAAVAFLLIPVMAGAFLVAQLGHGHAKVAAMAGYSAAAVGFVVCLVLMERSRARQETSTPHAGFGRKDGDGHR